MKKRRTRRLRRACEEEDNGPFLNMIGSNFDYMGMVKEKMYTGLKEGETYYIKVAPDYFSGTISFDPYLLSRN